MCFGLSKDKLRSTGSVATWMWEAMLGKEAVLGYYPSSHVGDKNSILRKTSPIFSQVTSFSNKLDSCHWLGEIVKLAHHQVGCSRVRTSNQVHKFHTPCPLQHICSLGGCQEWALAMAGPLHTVARFSAPSPGLTPYLGWDPWMVFHLVPYCVGWGHTLPLGDLFSSPSFLIPRPNSGTARFPLESIWSSRNP